MRPEVLRGLRAGRDDNLPRRAPHPLPMREALPSTGSDRGRSMKGQPCACSEPFRSTAQSNAAAPTTTPTHPTTNWIAAAFAPIAAFELLLPLELPLPLLLPLPLPLPPVPAETVLVLVTALGLLLLPPVYAALAPAAAKLEMYAESIVVTVASAGVNAGAVTGKFCVSVTTPLPPAVEQEPNSTQADWALFVVNWGNWAWEGWTRAARRSVRVRMVARVIVPRA